MRSIYDFLGDKTTVKTKKEIESEQMTIRNALQSCFSVEKKSIEDFGSIQGRTRNKDVLYRMILESQERTPAYYIGRTRVHNEDPIDYQVKSMKEILDFDYINRTNTKKQRNKAYEEMKRVLKSMRSRDSPSRITKLKEEYDNLSVVSSKSPKKKSGCGSHVYKISEKIKTLEKNTDLNDVHQRFQLLQQYVNQYKEKICQNGVGVESSMARHSRRRSS